VRDWIPAIARARVPAGFLFGVLVLWLSQPTRRTVIVGSVIAMLGEAIRIWAAGHLEKGREVTSSGPYRWTRHPLYAGSAVMGAGLAVASADVVVALAIAAYLGLALSAAIRTEEAFVRQKFGPLYDEYCAGRLSVARPFSWRRAFANREHRALVGLIVAIAVLALKAW
jgi:protein-S-isoprenylcysteine O-methyltransferase Ste14